MAVLVDCADAQSMFDLHLDLCCPDGTDAVRKPRYHLEKSYIVVPCSDGKTLYQKERLLIEL